MLCEHELPHCEPRLINESALNALLSLAQRSLDRPSVLSL